MNTLKCKDILYKELIENDYYNLKSNQKKILVNEKLKYYLLDIISCFNIYNDSYKNYSVNELVDYLYNKVTIVPIIIFIISIMNDIQQSKISWIIYPDIINNEIIYKNNIIDKIITNEKYNDVFNLIYDHYINQFDLENYKTLTKKQD